jgi:exosortase/archaeosortase
MRIKQYADFGFISGYAGLFVVTGTLLIPRGRAIAILAAVLGVVAAIFDVIENLGTLRVVNTDLAHTTQAMIDAVRYPSLIKWALASLALGLLAILFLRLKRAGPRVVGALYLIAALLGLYGLYDNAILQWTGIPMLAGFIGLAILYFRPYRRNAG